MNKIRRILEYARYEHIDKNTHKLKPQICLKDLTQQIFNIIDGLVSTENAITYKDKHGVLYISLSDLGHRVAKLKEGE